MTDDERAMRFAEAAFAAAGRGPLAAGERAEDMNRPFIHPRYGRTAPRMKPFPDLPSRAQDKIRRDLQSKLDAMMLRAMAPSVAGGTTTSCAGKPFSFDDLTAAMDKLAQIPPPPLIGSSKRFPADHFLRFTHDGRDHFLGHPDLWVQVFAALPVRSDPSANPLTSLEVVNLDAENRTEALAEMAVALAKLGIKLDP